METAEAARASTDSVAQIDASSTKLAISLPKLVTLCVAAMGLGVTIGALWARIDAHEDAGHAQEKRDIQDIKVILARTTAVLERLEKRSP